MNDSDADYLASPVPNSPSCSAATEGSPEVNDLHTFVRDMIGLSFSDARNSITQLLEANSHLSVNDRDAYGTTPLQEACEYGCTGAVAALLSLGASRVVCASDGRLPIHVAARRGDLETVKVLLLNDGPSDDAIIQIEMVDAIAGWNALHYSLSAGHIEVAKALLAMHKGSALTSIPRPLLHRDRWGATPLDYLKKKHTLK